MKYILSKIRIVSIMIVFMISIYLISISINDNDIKMNNKLNNKKIKAFLISYESQLYHNGPYDIGSILHIYNLHKYLKKMNINSNLITRSLSYQNPFSDNIKNYNNCKFYGINDCMQLEKRSEISKYIFSDVKSYKPILFLNSLLYLPLVRYLIKPEFNKYDFDIYLKMSLQETRHI